MAVRLPSAWRLTAVLFLDLFLDPMGLVMQSETYQSLDEGYRVPQRFSIAEILAMMTVFGLLFGALRHFGAPATLYLFLGTQAVVICLVQMRFGEVPRGASTIVGCIFLPIWVWSLSAFGNGSLPTGFEGSLADLPIVLGFGGLLGYCTGALAAGVFLVLDTIEDACHRMLRDRRSS